MPICPTISRVLQLSWHQCNKLIHRPIVKFTIRNRTGFSPLAGHKLRPKATVDKALERERRRWTSVLRHSKDSKCNAEVDFPFSIKSSFSCHLKTTQYTVVQKEVLSRAFMDDSLIFLHEGRVIAKFRSNKATTDCFVVHLFHCACSFKHVEEATGDCPLGSRTAF